ncbi:MAG: tRNA (adenosine(37)-N6)-threonylcarbamoyltransferase complex dimerization subunit type 1 TsaB [Elusimicrobia bacterium]|nr:tRNA (adenosine(37)-N6)-threonylcarbamoyltransferase complex dimerization subunit type 1 TsaB [Elusimicrobiota bacterium]
MTTPKPPDRVLAVDTTEDMLSAALRAGGKDYAASVEAGRGHDSMLFTVVERLLKKARLAMEDLTALASASGPGRFTGIRIGMTFCAVAGSRLSVPVIAVSRLSALAFREAGACRQAGAERVCAVIPGWKEERYHQLFSCAGALRPLAPPSWSKPEDWALAWPAIKEGGAAVVEAVPGAREVLAYGLELLSRKRLPAYEPLYLKPAGYERKTG